MSKKPNLFLSDVPSKSARTSLEFLHRPQELVTEFDLELSEKEDVKMICGIVENYLHVS